MRIASLIALAALTLVPILFAQTPTPLPLQTTAGMGFTGEPYSAKETTVKVQTAVDGAQNFDTFVQLLWRDAQGRTRREDIQHDASGAEYHSVIITDPIAGVYLKWTIQNGLAGRVVTIWPLSDAQKITAPPPPYSAGPINTAPQSCGQDCTREVLAPQQINSEYAMGSRVNRTVRAGTQGHITDSIVIDENWVSPDLRIIMRHVTNDPSDGLTTTDLTDVIRGDPDPSLFVAPPGSLFRDMRQSTPSPATSNQQPFF
jgi:hypothetical protein